MINLNITVDLVSLAHWLGCRQAVWWKSLTIGVYIMEPPLGSIGMERSRMTRFTHFVFHLRWHHWQGVDVLLDGVVDEW